MTSTPYFWPLGGRHEMLKGGIADTNRSVAGTIGFVRLAKMVSDGAAQEFGIYLLNKALISRFGQEKIVKYLYDSGLQTIPTDSNWQAMTT